MAATKTFCAHERSLISVKGDIFPNAASKKRVDNAVTTQELILRIDTGEKPTSSLFVKYGFSSNSKVSVKPSSSSSSSPSVP